MRRRLGARGMWSDFSTYEEAEQAARDLITKGIALEADVLEITSTGGRALAKVKSASKADCPCGRPVVKKYKTKKE